MLLHLKTGLSPEGRQDVARAARDAGFLVQHVSPDMLTLFGEGDLGAVADHPAVERVAELPTGPVLAGRGDHPRTTAVSVGDVSIGVGFTVIAGPCAVESRPGLLHLATAAEAAGADMLRGGAFKPRTSPYSFRGLGAEGLEILAEARESTGLPVVTEVLDTRDVALVARHADMIQIGTRNMMNYALLAEVAGAGKPVLLKRGMGATVGELVNAAEYLMVGGSPGVVLCERGVRCFGDLRFVLDLAVVPQLRRQTHLPVIVDPSHATGRRELVPAMARAAAAAGAAGVMVEIHDEPESALSDGRQAMRPEILPGLVGQLREIARIASKATEEETP